MRILEAHSVSALFSLLVSLAHIYDLVEKVGKNTIPFLILHISAIKISSLRRYTEPYCHCTVQA